MKKQLKYDVRYLTSALLLILTAIVSVTGFIADVWDINDFIVHTYTGYGMATMALLHAVLEWPRLWGYVRGRLRRKHTQGTPTPHPAKPKSAETITASQPRLSRHGLLGLLVGGVGGFALGRIPPRQMPASERRDLGIQYHQWSGAGIPGLSTLVTDWGTRPPQYKSYPDALRVALPAPGEQYGLYTEQAIQQRRSIRNYTDAPMTMDELSRLLHYTNGVTTERRGTRLRSAPSAGALYPIETYVIAHRVENLEPGLYHYAVRDHALHTLRPEDLRVPITRAGILQGFLGEANVVLVFTAIFQRLRWKYRERSYRYALLEAGHIGQNVYLAAASMGIGACAVGAFDDDAVNALIGVDGVEEAAVYVLAFGKI